jgi:adenylosuccinate synthase
MGDLRDWSSFKTKYAEFIEAMKYIYRIDSFDAVKELHDLQELSEKMMADDMIVDTIQYMHQAIDNPKKRIIAEGANAALLDMDFGTYPYVTSSSTTVGGVCTGLGVPPQRIETTIGIMKAYTTRVGAGPFPTEDTGPAGEMMGTVG